MFHLLSAVCLQSFLSPRSLLSTWLLDLFKHLVGHNHRSWTPTLSFPTDANIKKGVVQGSAHGVVVSAVGFATGGPTVVDMVSRLLLLTDRLLAAISGWLLLAALQVESEVGGRPVSCRLHAHFLCLTHLIVFHIFDDLRLVLLLMLLARGGLGLVVGLVDSCDFSGSIANVVASAPVEVDLLVHWLGGRGGAGHVQLALAGLLA